MPFLVAVDVTGTNSVTVRFQEPDSHDSPICTKFKVQWSIKEDFSVICGEREVLDMKQRECRIDDLIQGQKYYFRAAAGNLKGYSRFRNSTPAHVTPSSTIIFFYFLSIECIANEERIQKAIFVNFLPLLIYATWLKNSTSV